MLVTTATMMEMIIDTIVKLAISRRDFSRGEK
jgi:hypothetical protein